MNGTCGYNAIAFTWSPDPSKFYYIDVKMQFSDTVTFIRNLDLCSTYEIYPELNANGNIHYHGTVCLTDKIKWYKSVLPKFRYYGMVKIKDKNLNEGWNQYIQKDSIMMTKLLNVSLPLVNSKRKKSYPNYVDMGDGAIAAPGGYPTIIEDTID